MLDETPPLHGDTCQNSSRQENKKHGWPKLPKIAVSRKPHLLQCSVKILQRSHTCRRTKRSWCAFPPMITRFTCCRNTPFTAPELGTAIDALLAFMCNAKIQPIACCSGTSSCRMLSIKATLCPSAPECASEHAYVSAIAEDQASTSKDTALQNQYSIAHFLLFLLAISADIDSMQRSTLNRITSLSDAGQISKCLDRIVRLIPASFSLQCMHCKQSRKSAPFWELGTQTWLKARSKLHTELLLKTAPVISFAA
jgi:hypothetical protein